jgi:hypothetical protein
MISVNGSTLALMSAVFARVHSNENHKWVGDAGIDEIGKEIGATISVYDAGRIDNKVRHVRFDFDGGSFEVAVCPRPALINTDDRPDGDHPTPGTPVALAA